MIQGFVLYAGAAFAAINLLVDLAYGCHRPPHRRCRPRDGRRRSDAQPTPSLPGRPSSSRLRATRSTRGGRMHPRPAARPHRGHRVRPRDHSHPGRRAGPAAQPPRSRRSRRGSQVPRPLPRVPARHRPPGARRPVPPALRRPPLDRHRRVCAVLFITIVGIGVGMLAGWYGGVRRHRRSAASSTCFLALPTFLLALAVTALLGPGLRNVMVAIVLAWWPIYARIVRGVVLSERSKPYVESARAVGSSSFRIIRSATSSPTSSAGHRADHARPRHRHAGHLRPLLPRPGRVAARRRSGAPCSSEGRTYLSVAPHMMFFPGAAIFLMVLGFNLLGDGLRDVLDPRTRRRRR